jgi:hypothetical protein
MLLALIGLFRGAARSSYVITPCLLYQHGTQAAVVACLRCSCACFRRVLLCSDCIILFVFLGFPPLNSATEIKAGYLSVSALRPSSASASLSSGTVAFLGVSLAVVAVWVALQAARALRLRFVTSYLDL